MQKTDILISFVIPVFNEVDTVQPLADQVRKVCGDLDLTIELLFVDDGSTDGSWEKIAWLAEQDQRVKGIRFRTNFGKAAALDAGFRRADGKVVFQMDGDLQDDPAEIPNFLSRLEEGFDAVNGWKKKRHDPWHKVWPSRVFNWMVSAIMGLRLHDHNCGFKCWRAEAIKEIRVYGELHRFIPVIAHARGFRVTEIPVQHHPRRHGVSKYGAQRFLKGFLDLLTVKFIYGFGQRPQHFLGGLGVAAFGGGLCGLTYLAICWVLARLEIGNFAGTTIGDRPLLLYSVAAMLLGFHMLSIGFLAELLIALSRDDSHAYSIVDNTDESHSD